jgi:PAS domain S-box-containing protein
MKSLLNNFIHNLNDLVKSDLTLLVKFDQKTFTLLDSNSKTDLGLSFNSITNKLEILDFANLNELLLSELNYSSYLLDSFNLGNNQYFILCLSKNKNNFAKNETYIHSVLTKTVKEIITEIEINNKKLNTNQDYFHLISETSGEFIFILDKYGKFNFVNKFGLEKLKYTVDEILGKHFFELISEDFKGEVAEAFQKIISEKKQISFTAEIIPKVSVEQLFEISLIPVFENESMIQLLGIGKNVSQQNAEKKKNEELLAKLTEANRINSIERDRAQQQISILSELNNLKNEFISNVSHELRTPLASIIGFSETIIDDKNLTIERAKEFTDVILEESKRLAKLINDVLDFSELENEKQHLEKKSIDIIDILRECTENYIKECADKNISLTSKLPESEIIIFADQNRLKKAFNYLLTNALKFTNENGRITLIAQEFLKEVEIVISDTGVGIPDQKMPLLFDKFSKIKRTGKNLPGAGFGLVAVKQIIDLHNGLIRVKSEVDRGTSFIIRLPKNSYN